MLLNRAVVLLATFLLAASVTQGDHDDCVFVATCIYDKSRLRTCSSNYLPFQHSYSYYTLILSLLETQLYSILKSRGWGGGGGGLE